MSSESQVHITETLAGLEAAIKAEECREVLFWTYGFLVGLAENIAARVFDPGGLPMRDKDEVSKAHDKLHAIVLGEVPNPFKTDTANAALTSALDVLCWMLRHDHNDTFAKNLRQLDEYLLACGFQLRRVP